MKDTSGTWAAQSLRGVLLITAFCIAASSTDAATSAVVILEAAGIQGGLIVHVGCGDGRLTVSLRANDGYLVHGLAASAEDLAAARRHIHSKGLYGKVSADSFDGRNLPYIDNLVNLLLVTDETTALSDQEILRVLVPGGVGLIHGRKIVKPRPADIDDWTHYLHGPDNNAVAKDRQVGSPRRLQWTANPQRTRDHDALASMSAMTSSGGRIFYILDEGPTSLTHRPPDWKLVARDAFNGVLLWKREIPTWITHLQLFRCGPAQMTRRLVSIGDTVFVTLGFDAPVTMLDAATGRTLQTFPKTQKTEEILCHKDVLLTVLGDPDELNREAPNVFGYWQLSVDRAAKVQKSLVAHAVGTGKTLWKKTGPKMAQLVPLSLTARGDNVFFLDGENLNCLDLVTGELRWKAPFPTQGLFLRNYTPTVVAADGVIICLTWDRLHAFDVHDGKKLWQQKGAVGFAAAGDLFVIDGLAWVLPMTKSIWKENKVNADGKIVSGIRLPLENFIARGQEYWGIDIHTGRVEKRFPMKMIPAAHHHRCYRNKATERFLVTGRRGLEYIDVNGENHVFNAWIRGLCQYGVMPANGLTYVPPDPCQCFTAVKFNGFKALAAKSSLDDVPAGGPSLEKGPAFADARQASPRRKATDARLERLYSSADAPVWQPPIADPAADDWPMHRRDITRSCSTPSPVPAELKKLWTAQIGGNLSAAVIAQERVYVTSTDGQIVYCLDADTGSRRWQFFAGGGVDSPPSIYDGLCVFGSRDGSVYCLEADDGKLVWRFRAAPVDRRAMADSRLESPWPISGSVLIQEGVAYFAAGRTSYLDGGIKLFGLDVYSGKTLHQTSLFATADGEEPWNDGPMIGALPDVLISDGVNLTMRHLQFDKRLTPFPTAKLKTIMATTGLLEDAWAHRQNLVLGGNQKIPGGVFGGKLNTQFKGYGFLGRTAKLMAFDDRVVYCVKNPYSWLKYAGPAPPSHDGHIHRKYSRFDADSFPIGVRIDALPNRAQEPTQPAESAKRRRSPDSVEAPAVWTVEQPFQPRGIVLAHDRLFLAGWIDSLQIQERTGRAIDPDNRDPRPAVLRVLATADGRQLAEYKLSAEPVFDAMSAANGRLYLSLKDGTLLCMAAAP